MKRFAVFLLLAFVALFVAACGGEQAQPTATAMITMQPSTEPTAPALAAEPESAGDLTSYPWLWTSFTSQVERFDVNAPEDYVETFNDDGTVNIKTDCNNASGSYSVEARSLAMGKMLRGKRRQAMDVHLPERWLLHPEEEGGRVWDSA